MSWMIPKPEFIETSPRRGYAMVLMLIGSITISFGGLVVRNIETADNWQINFYRSIAFGTAILIVLLFRYGKTGLQQFKGIGLQGVWAATVSYTHLTLPTTTSV